MKNSKWIWAFVLVSVLAIACTLWAQDQMLQVEKSSFPNPAREPARFDHDQHNEAAGLDDCSVCHHLFEDGKLLEGESSEDQACSECHNLKPEKEKGLPLMKAYHVRCKECHVKEKKGPVMCGECHTKNGFGAGK